MFSLSQKPGSAEVSELLPRLPGGLFSLAGGRRLRLHESRNLYAYRYTNRKMNAYIDVYVLYMQMYMCTSRIRICMHLHVFLYI